jgi:Surface antigen variable number repeat
MGKLGVSYASLLIFASVGMGGFVSAQSNTCPTKSTQGQDTLKNTAVVVDQVQFEGENPLTDSEQADLVDQIKRNAASTTPDGSNTDWAADDTEVLVRTVLQDKGYLQLQLSDTPYLIRTSNDGLHYGLTIGIKSGPQFRLGTVSVINSDERKPLAFSDTVLREQLDLQYGDLFNASKIRAAMETITRMYGSHGYLDMVPEPEMSFDEKDLRIDLTLKMDEGVCYRISAIDLLGVENNPAKLRMPQAIGQPVNRASWRKFFNDNRSLFPEGAKFDSSIKMVRKVRDLTTQITVDFRACPVQSTADSGTQLTIRTDSSM